MSAPAGGPSAEDVGAARPPPEHSALGDLFGWVIVELAPDGILVVDEAGRIMLANRHLSHLFGHDRSELVGQRVEHLIPVSSGDGLRTVGAVLQDLDDAVSQIRQAIFAHPDMSIGAPEGSSDGTN